MKRLDLDFSPYKARRRLHIGIFALFLTLLVGAFLLMQQQKLNRLLNEVSATRTLPSHADTKADLRLNNIAEKQASVVMVSLQRPWLAMFDALEQAQSANEAVHLLSIQPNPAKGEVMLTGEATDFSSLLSYISKLKEQSQFVDVALISQRRVERDHQPALAFSLMIQWKT